LLSKSNSPKRRFAISSPKKQRNKTLDLEAIMGSAFPLSLGYFSFLKEDDPESHAGMKQNPEHGSV